MDDDKKPETTPEEQPSEPTVDTASENAGTSNDDDNSSAASVDQAPADALSMTPEELEDARTEQAAADTDLSGLDDPSEEKLSPAKKFFRKVNVYFLLFVLILIVAGAITAVNFLNSQKAPEEAAINSQSLSQDALKQLANTDTSVGNASQTLTIQGNAIISGQTLTRGNLNVAGNVQTGGSLTAPTLTISGAVNLGDTQANNLQVATNVAIQGSTTMRDLNVAGTSTFGGAMTASQITVSRLVLSGNASLEVPNHIRFSGPSPSRTFNVGILGNGGSASVDGSDTSGTINVNSGNNPASGCFMRVIFQRQFANSPHVIISPVGSAAGQMEYYVERDKTGFNVCSANPAPSNKAFAFDYFITN